MNKKEQEFIQKLKEKTDDIQIPGSLEPENMIQMLEKRGKKKRTVSPYRIGALAAACLVLVAGIAVYTNGNLKRDIAPDKKENIEISDSKTVAQADTYEEVYSYIEQYKKEIEEAEAQLYSGAANTEESKMESVEDMAQADTGAMQNIASEGMADSARTAGGSDYSETNVRQEGVDEGDIVKTDGTYLYVLKDNRTTVSIVDTRDDMKELKNITVEDTEWIQEIYLSPEKKRLILVCSKSPAEETARSAYWYSGNTEAITYDIEDPENPKETGRVTQSGYYQSSRLADGYLYLFSNYDVAWDSIEKKSPETYIPFVNDSVIAEKDICLPAIPEARTYVVVTAVSMENPDKVADSKAILSKGGELYVSNENIYYYETVWKEYLGYGEEQTSLRRISYKDGILKPEAQGKVSGYINDSFSIDEYKEHLRIVTTEGESNSVYVLNMNLETVGQIKGLAKDERVYSARLMGDTGYFVTFRETDPLFSVDLSDPCKPEIIGALKIPGFSDYLHPYGDGKLLGIGMNVDEETMVTDGVKLTMFDISNPADVKEEDTYILENVYSTEVSYDYKAALVDSGRNIIGFSGYTEGGQKYYIFEYDKNNGFVCRMEEEINGNGSLSSRGVYIADMLYVVQGNIIEAYSLKEYVKVDDIIL